MTPEIKKTTVYVPTLVMEEMPSKGSLVSVSFDGGVSFSYEATGKGWKHNEVNYTHWLKPIPEAYVFTPEELLALRRKWAGEAWRDGYRRGLWEEGVPPQNQEPTTLKLYLNSLTIE